jgi:putative ABC transport system ATP-binding protein
VQPDSTNPAAAVVRAEDLVKVYGRGGNEVTALDHVTVGFEAGRFTAVMGPSGSGKSTLMHCVSGLDRPTSGRVLLDGRDLAALSDRDATVLRRTEVGFVFQSFNLVPTLTARENITLPLDLAGRAPDRDHLDDLVDVLGLAARIDHRPSELSGGQQQRVAIARALVTRPAIVLADEPTGALDTKTSGEILRYLQQAARDYDQTIVMVTHDPVAAAHTDRVVFLADGRIVHELREPSADAVLEQLKHLGARREEVAA